MEPLCFFKQLIDMEFIVSISEESALTRGLISWQIEGHLTRTLAQPVKFASALLEIPVLDEQPLWVEKVDEAPLPDDK